jgi:hypothetical protein
MKSLRVIRAKPNPTGKDRTGSYIRPAQLVAEWVDFQNDGDIAFPLEPITLYHLAFQDGCRDPKWEKVMSFTGTLQPRKIVRVHSGEKLELHEMYQEDLLGADHHCFTGRRAYIWNNDCGDVAGLYDGSTFEDKAGYDPHPPEGLVLRRVGDKLVP